MQETNNNKKVVFPLIRNNFYLMKIIKALKNMIILEKRIIVYIKGY